jgi:tetratricopeptide (TPR) repeat protein
MKSCPTCNRTFEDTLTYCLIDGSILSAPFDPHATLIIPEARQTQQQQPTALLGSYSKHQSTTEALHPFVAFEQPVKKSNRLPWVIGGIVALLIVAASIAYIVNRNSTNSNLSGAKVQSASEGESLVKPINPKGTAAQLAKESKSLFKQSKYVEAEFKIREAIKVDPNNLEWRDDLRLLLIRQGKESEEIEVAKEAEGLLREALRSDPNNAKYHIFLSGALRSQKKLMEAEKEDREAIRLDPNDAKAHRYLSNTLQQQNRLEEAEAEAREAVRIDPDDYNNHYALGGTLARQKKYVEAEKSMREAIRLAPNYTHAHSALGNIVNQQNRSAEAEVIFRDAIKLAPTIALNHFYLAHSLFKQGRLKESEAELQEAIKLDPSDSSYKELLQQLRDEMNKK